MGDWVVTDDKGKAHPVYNQPDRFSAIAQVPGGEAARLFINRDYRTYAEAEKPVKKVRLG